MTSPIPDDALPGLVEAVAEALFARDHVPYSDTAHPDHNRWSWRGDGHDEAYKDEWRVSARAAVAAVVEHLGLVEERIKAETLDSVEDAAREAYTASTRRAILGKEWEDLRDSEAGGWVVRALRKAMRGEP